MATKRRSKSTRRDELVHSSPFTSVRRSPRLSSQRAQPVTGRAPLSSHQLHHAATVTRSSRSNTPSTILDESGQSVPPSFLEEPVSAVIPPISAHLRVTEVQERAGMPKQLFGLDYEEEIVSPPVVPEIAEETPRMWQVYNKERLYVTAERSPGGTPQGSSQPQEPGSRPSKHSSVRNNVSIASSNPLSRQTNSSVRQTNSSVTSSSFSIHGLFSSLLFKLGSLLYLASTGVMCLDVIILHRLFNLPAAVSSQISGILRFFLLLVTLLSLGFFLAGWPVATPPEAPPVVVPPPTPPVSPPPVSPPPVSLPPVPEVTSSELENLKSIFQTGLDQINARLDAQHIENAISMEDSKKIKDSLKQIPTKEEVKEEVGRMKEQLQTQVDDLAAELRDLKKENSITAEEIKKIQDSLKQIPLKEELDLLRNQLQSQLSALDLKIKAVENMKTNGTHKITEIIISETLKKELEKMINVSIEAYHSDRMLGFDFLLENSGGSVMLGHCSPTYTHSIATVSLFGIPLWHISSSPKVIIQPSHHPGDCWAMEGQSGYATIKMSAKAVVTSVTVDHIPEVWSPNGTRSSAPKNFTVYGMQELSEEKTNLGSFGYDLSGPPVQNFPIDENLRKAYRFLTFKFTSNYGHYYTCIYRLRAHGHYPEFVA